ncbi:rRNA accumulation- protein [Coemansia sp. RSA 2706]|nr:rRNA accumulation- protein [Coemansia sp. RSA 2706]
MGGPEMHPNQAAFVEGVDHILSKWTALELAVKHEWGGRSTQDKRDNMVDEISDYFDTLVRKRQTPEPTDLQGLLLDILDDDFSIALEDDSEKEVARLICIVFNECKTGNYATVDRLAAERDAREKQGNSTAAMQSQGNGQQGDSDDSDSGASDSDVSMEE